ncbi:Enteropeptidase [Holothuria leucospilota]|uniref:Enteropeptidase n=1 Tax=Holothuria leucospilota TaxID=206669 RepID=A0A9Q0YDT5_HOLLE|nr:Enteropeptidase [Holothuria leucospilota]
MKNWKKPIQGRKLRASAQNGGKCGYAAANPRLQDDGRIVGGVDATTGSWPWIGSLRSSAGNHICGASLINSQWAVTAAHCVGYFDSIVLGDLRTDSESPYHEERKFTIFTHPDYIGSTNENDIALLRLDSNVTLTDYISPICLTTDENEAITYSNCLVGGWGDTSEGGSPSTILQEAAVNLFTDSQCNGYLGSALYEEVMICAGKSEGGIDTCQGDSGGPLICKHPTDMTWDLVGITSWGYGCARPNSPGVYTRVSKFEDFINGIISESYLECSNGAVYTSNKLCDNIADCPNGEDEENCPKMMSSDIIDITSPNYPSNYPDNQAILWVFETEDPSAQIRLHFLHFDLEDGYDFIYAGSGWDPYDSGSYLLQHTGNTLPEDVVSTGNRMWVGFNSDYSVHKQGFFIRVSVDGEEGGMVECSDEMPCLGDYEECVTINLNERITETKTCECIAGYVREEGVCEDQNECLHPELNTCDAVAEICLNTNGSFVCQCKPEYTTGMGCDIGGEGNGGGGETDPNACGTRPIYEENLNRVVGGVDASEGAWPWIGSLRASSHSCGATLVDEEWAITAAHCVGYFYRVIFGDLKLDTVSPYNQERSFTIFQHPNYNDDTSDHDIAILRLTTKVNVTGYVRPACLATSETEVTTYSTCYVAGWGATSEGGNVANILQEAQVNLFTDEECYGFYGSEYNPDTMICAGYSEGGIDTCQGDSGGPLVCEGNNGQWHLVGVTSWGYGCARPNQPGVYTRISKHIDYIEQVINTDFDVCSDGSIFLPDQRCDFALNCNDGSDEVGCDNVLQEGEMVPFSSPNYPEDYPNSQDIVYIVHSENGTQMNLHFMEFHLESGYDFLTVGNGDDRNDDGSIVDVFSGTDIPSDILTTSNVFWLRFTSDGSITKAGYLIHVSVMTTEASYVCNNGLVIPERLVCDILADCPNADDEENCDPLPEGFFKYIRSPLFPNDYPNDLDITYIFNAEDHLNMKVAFEFFDLETDYDFLTVGHGNSPDDDSSVIEVLTGSSLPRNIVSPLSSMWIRFTSDHSVRKAGFTLNVTATSAEREPCSEYHGAILSTKSLERYQTTRGEDCGIAIVANNVDRRVQIEIEDAEINCNAGEYIVLQRTVGSGRNQRRQTLCGTINRRTITAGDAVMLVEYHLKIPNHGFRLNYRYVQDSSPNFQGCNSLVSLISGPVTITSPRYPSKYPSGRRCEYRVVASPGKRIHAEFDEFILQNHATCKLDYLRFTDFISNAEERHCGRKEELIYDSDTNYVSLFFRTNNNRNFKGFRATLSETD